MTDEQVREMWLAGQRDELTAQLKGIAVHLATVIYERSMQGTDVELDDVVSWALESMWKAIESWEPDTEVPLRGWIAFKVVRDIKNIQRDRTRQKRGGAWRRVPMDILEDRGNERGNGSGSDWPDGKDGDYRPDMNSKLARSMPAVQAEEDAVVASLDTRRALEDLPEHQRYILQGLSTGASLRDVGKALGISHEWVRREAEKARASIRERLA